MDQSTVELAEWAKSLPGDFSLTTAEAARFLAAHGIALKPATLVTWRNRRSDGPPWVRYPWGAVAYRVDELRGYLDRLHGAAA